MKRFRSRGGTLLRHVLGRHLDLIRRHALPLAFLQPPTSHCPDDCATVAEDFDVVYY